MADPDPLEALFGLIPDAASNPVGTALHHAWVKVVEATVPGGHWLQRSDAGDITPYSTLLYGCSGPADEGWESILLDATGSAVRDVLGAGWWTPYAEALTVQTVYNLAMTVRNQVNAAAVDSDVAARHDALRGSALAGYVIAFAATYQAQLAAVPGTGPARRQAYREKLGPPWVALKTAEYNNANWPDPGWDLFHHAVKLLALGAAQADITAVLTDLAARKLPMPDVQPANWTTYAKYAPDPMLQWADMAVDGRVGMLHYSDDGGESWDMVNEGIAQWYVADTPYWIQPQGSCFTSSASVLLPDGSERTLSEVKPGDEVWTPDGPRAVRVVARAQRRGRSLHRFAGAGFAFSDSHPFVAGDDPRRSLAVHPARAGTFAGGLAAYGVEPLEAGVSLAAVTDGVVGPLAAPAVEEVSGPDLDEALLDLILGPSPGGFPSYAVGDAGGPYYVVRSEVLRYETYPHGTHVGLNVLTGSLDASAAALADLDRTDAVAVVQAVRLLADRLVAEAVAELGAQGPTPAEPGSDAFAVDQELDSLLGAFNGSDGEFDWRLGALQEAFVSSLLVRLDDLVEGGWRPVETDLDAATRCAITVHDVVGEGHQPLTGAWTIELDVDGAPVLHMSLPDGDDADHRRKVRWTVADAVPYDGGHVGAKELGVRLTGPDGAVLAGSAFLPARIARGHAERRIALRRDPGGEVDAIVSFDVRPLGPSLVSSHPAQAPDDWDDAARAAYADRAVAVLAPRFAELFPQALAATRG